MPATLLGYPLWAVVLVAVVAAYLIYRYWRYRKSVAYAPKIVKLQDTDFRSPRDNPPKGG